MTVRSKQTSPKQDAPPQRVVVLVHGIRTRANWHIRLRETLEGAGFDVKLTNYGYFNLFKFLVPFPFFRRRAQDRVYRQIRDIKLQNPNAEYSIVAHSFGTHVIANLIKDQFDIPKARIIFLASVLDQDFPFEEYSQRFESPILNMVGVKDIFPVLAAQSTFTYGSAGTFGFRTPRVRDVYGDWQHSSTLLKDICSNIWIPFLENGTVPAQPAYKDSPFYITALAQLPLRYFNFGVVFLLLLFIAVRLTTDRFEYRLTISEGASWNLQEIEVDEKARDYMREECVLSNPFLDICQTVYWEWISGRSWVPLTQYDETKIKAVEFPTPVDKVFSDPLGFWMYLQEISPDCVKVTQDRREVNVTVPAGCNQSS